MDESVVEGGENVAHSEVVLLFISAELGRAVVDNFFLVAFFFSSLSFSLFLVVRFLGRWLRLHTSGEHQIKDEQIIPFYLS